MPTIEVSDEAKEELDMLIKLYGFKDYSEAIGKLIMQYAALANALGSLTMELINEMQKAKQRSG